MGIAEMNTRSRLELPGWLRCELYGETWAAGYPGGLEVVSWHQAARRVLTADRGYTDWPELIRMPLTYGASRPKDA